jgi:hypothetical protein
MRPAPLLRAAVVGLGTTRPSMLRIATAAESIRAAGTPAHIARRRLALEPALGSGASAVLRGTAFPRTAIAGTRWPPGRVRRGGPTISRSCVRSRISRYASSLARGAIAGALLPVEPVARILVLTARAPVASPLLLPPRDGLGQLRLFRRIPDAPAREPAQLRIRVLLPQPLEGRQQLVALRRPERCWQGVDDDRPVRVTGRHGVSRLPEGRTT